MPQELNKKNCSHVGKKNMDCEGACLDYLTNCVPK